MEIKSCIKDVVEKMNSEEKGLLNIVLTYGKKANEVFKPDDLKNPNILSQYGNVNYENIAQQMNDVFISGFGLDDAIWGRDDNYGEQLQCVIDDVIVKHLKVTKPIFKSEPDTLDGILAREKFITEKLLESLWDRLPDEVKRELATEVEKMLIEKGIDPLKASQATGAIIIGSLTLARTILGFQFHILIAQLSNMLLKVLIGRGLTLVGNAALQRLVGVLFGPIGWIITGVLIIPVIAGLINPREYDKYIPAVFIIGLKRSQL